MEVKSNEIPPISYRHFKKSLKKTRPSVAQDDLKMYEEFNREFGGLGEGGEGEEDDEDDDNDSMDEEGDKKG